MPFGIGLGGGGGDTSPTTGGSGSGAPGGTAPGGGGGGGAAGSGSPGSPTAQPGPGGGAASLLSSQMFDVVRLTADRTEYGPPVFLGPNDTVSAMPKRSNTQPCFVATGGNSDAKFAPRLQLASTDNPVQLGVRTLKEIGVYSTVVGEGVTLIINRRA